MSESNAEKMMTPEPERDSERFKMIDGRLEEIEKQVRAIARAEERRSEPDSLGLDDIVQELVGAVTFALPFLFTSELWDVAKEISLWRAFAIFLLTMGIAYGLIAKSRIGNIRAEEVFHVPKRLITVSIISYTVSAGMIYLYGINRLAEFTLPQYLSATVITSTFAIVGAIAVDMVK
ncbi:MAG: hypothetical protein PWQ79_1598 [Thermococcaceae archaeon]|nr:hypothetical protein [Thermococcaceae archaeon]MDK2914683.1 hypothetical protein [Thermococcaceae archaeon]